MLGLIIGVFIGSFITIVIMSLMYMAKDYEPKKREPEQKEPKKREPEQKEPTVMWMVGNMCRWRGMMFEIKSFCATKSNQTVAVIERDDPEFHYSVCAPIEELEEVEE